MRSLIITLLVIMAFACAIFAKTIDQYPNYDLAPGVIPGSGSSAPTDEQWDLQYSWYNMEAQTGDNGLTGIAFDGTYLWVSGRNLGGNPQIYLFDLPNCNLLEQFNAGATSAWGIRDMCFDEIYMYGGWEEGLIKWDIETHEVIETIPIPPGMSFQRANAYDQFTDHFYCGNFGSTCYEQDRAGHLIRSWSPSPLGAVYGMAWDYDAPDGPWLWVHDQTNPCSGCWAHQMDPTTLTYTGFHISLLPPTGNGIAGGLDYAENVVPTHTSILVMAQGTPDEGVAFEMYGINYVTVNLTPINPPIQIPAGGGSFEFNIELTNNEPNPITFDVWTKAGLPLGAGGYVGPLIGPAAITLDSAASMERLLIQSVPERAPTGLYFYTAYVGCYPDTIWDWDILAFIKLGDGNNSSAYNWSWQDDTFPGESQRIASPETPSEFTLHPAYPNPFNPTTAISYQLPAASYLKLTVYDVTGREVSTLVDGLVEAGSYEVIFDGSGSASGVYFYRLSSENFQITKKMTIIK